MGSEFNLEKSTAILRIYTFAPQNMDMFKEYIDKFFEDVKYKNIKNVVFDVRGNLGGDCELLNYVLAYVYNKDFYVHFYTFFYLLIYCAEQNSL